MRRLILILTGIALTYSCGGGGGPGDADVHYRSSIDLAKPAATYLTAENHPAWGEKDCISCHQIEKHSAATKRFPVEEYQKLIRDALEKVGKKNSINVCSACHGLNGVSTRDGKIQRQCLVCHDEFEKIHFYNGTSSRSHFHDVNGDGKFDDSDCVVCHWQPDMDGIVELDTDFGKIGGTTINSINDLCLKCHSSHLNDWKTISQEAVADVDGDGEADEKITTSKVPPKIDYTANWHGDDIYDEPKEFKDIKLEGDKLFYTQHDPLLCTQCHNPHASNNDDLIIEKVGETLTVEELIKQIDKTEETKYALVDPQTTLYFEDMKFEGTVNAINGTYDLSNETLWNYVELPVSYIHNDTIVNVRNSQASLCAACHDGNEGSSSINKLKLPKDILNDHYNGSKCSNCHSHSGNAF